MPGFGPVGGGPVAGTPAGLPPMRVLQAPAPSTGLSAAATATLAATGNGNLLVLLVATGEAGVTHSAPAGWSAIPPVVGAIGVRLTLFYKLSCAAGTTAVTAGLSASVHWYAEAWEVIGTGAWALGATGSNTVQASPSSGAVTTSAAVEFVVAGIGEDVSDTFSSPTGFFVQDGNASGGTTICGGGYHRITSAAGTYSTTVSPGGANDFAGTIAAFTSGAPPAVPLAAAALGRPSARRPSGLGTTDLVDRGHPQNASRVAWWLALPNTSGGATWRDLMGAHDGTLTNVTSASGWRPTGRPGGRLQVSFDGVDDYVDCGTIPERDARPVTLAAWVNVADLSSIRYILGTTAATTGELEFRVDTTGALQLVNGGVALIGASTTTLAAGAWYRAVAVLTSSTYAFYVNGVAAGSGSATTATTAAPTSIGMRFLSSGVPQLPFAGALDDVAIIARAWSAADAAADYDLSLRGDPGVLHPTLAVRGFPVASAAPSGADTPARPTISPPSPTTIFLMGQ